MNSLSRTVEQAFQEAVLWYGSGPLTEASSRHKELSGSSALDLVLRMHGRASSPEVLDRLWIAVIDSYRRGPREFWGAVVLRTVAPTLLRTAAHIRHERDLGDDTNHHLIAAVLEAAAAEELVSPARWTPHRLATRAVTRTRRWLAAERRSRGLYLADLPEPAANLELEPSQLSALRDWIQLLGLGEEAAVLIYRNRVLGEPLTSIAAELGLSEGAVRMRRFRIEERIRQQQQLAA